VNGYKGAFMKLSSAQPTAEGSLRDSEKSIMEKWVDTAIQLLTTQGHEIKDAKGTAKKLKTELERLPEQFRLQHQQLAVHDRDIYELQQRIPAISDIKDFEKLQIDLKALRARINTAPVIPEAPPETLLVELKAWEAELKRQQESKERISVTPTLRKKYQSIIEQLKAQQNHYKQLTADWATYRAIRTRMEKALTEIEQQFTDTNSITT
jgi:DNA repair ATPase RecN